MTNNSEKSYIERLKASKSKIIGEHEKPRQKLGMRDDEHKNTIRQKKSPQWKSVSKDDKENVASYKKTERKPEIRTFNKNKSSIEFAEEIADKQGSEKKKDFQNADYSGSSLKGKDFSGCDLTGADFSNADLDGVNFNGAILKDAKFAGAKLKAVKLFGADIENIDLKDIDLDDLTLEELQELIEYLAVSHPEKLNLTLINLALLDLSKIDLSRVNLAGVDFTGVDFTGVNIMEMDLSETNITPKQIEQALGRIPTPEELRFLLMPKDKNRKFKGIDIGIGPQGYKDVGVWNAHTDPKASIRIEKIMKLTKDLISNVMPTKEKEEENLEIENEIQASKIGMSEHDKVLTREDVLHQKEEEMLKKTIEDRKLDLRIEKEKEQESVEHEIAMEKMSQDKRKKMIEEKKKKHLEDVRAKQKANDANKRNDVIRINRNDRGR